MISLFGMILVVGILVDDGIVIAENIYAHFERGKSPMRAALDGTTEVMNAVLTSVLTTVFAFSTLLFVGGEMEMMEEMEMNDEEMEKEIKRQTKYKKLYSPLNNIEILMIMIMILKNLITNST